MSESEMNGLYYAKPDGRVFRRPERRTKPDGTTSTTMGFPVLSTAAYAGDGAAETVAELMNRGEAAPAMAAEIDRLKRVNAGLVEACRYIVEAGDTGDEMKAIEMARAALAVTGE